MPPPFRRQHIVRPPQTNQIRYYYSFIQRRTNISFLPLSQAQEKSSLLVQAVVETGDKTWEGDIIVAVLPVWEEIVKLIEKDPEVIFQIDPRKWEEIIAASYEKHGFDEVILTPRSGDFGRDVIATKKGFWSVRVIESVKRFNPNHLVPADDVRALLGILASDRNASKGVISTTSDFAPLIKDDPFIKPHIPNRLELINGNQLIARLKSLDES